MDVAEWLQALGLGQYEAAFRENDVDVELLPNLTADDLRVHPRSFAVLAEFSDHQADRRPA